MEVLEKDTLGYIKSHTKYGDELLKRFVKDSTDDVFTLKELGALNNIAPDFLIELLSCFDKGIPLDFVEAERFDRFSIKDILGYLYSTHAFYKEYWFPLLESELFKTMEKGDIGKNISGALVDSFLEMKNELDSHMKKEEEVLFTYTESLMKAAESNVLNCFFNQRVEICFQHSADETDFNVFKIIKWLLPYFFNYDNTSVLINLEYKFKRFKRELEVHAWVEEELLIPRVIELRQQLIKEKYMNKM